MPATPDDLAPPDGLFLVLYDAGRAVASGGIERFDARTAEVKRMFVAPEARGRGHGRRLLAALARGATRVVLDTAAPLAEATALYLAAGYREVPAYDDNPYAARGFEKALASP